MRRDTKLDNTKARSCSFGDLANLQGRVAGENVILGNVAKYPGTIQTGVCKVFDYGVGSTGLSEQNAIKLGFNNIETVVNTSLDKPGFMKGQLLITKLVVDKSSGLILGAQVIGPGDVSKQLAIWAIAIKGKFTVEDMVNADLPYAPPFSLAIDHSIATAHIMQNKLRGLFKGISSEELKNKLNNKEPIHLIDVRNPNEFEQMRLALAKNLFRSDSYVVVLMSCRKIRTPKSLFGVKYRLGGATKHHW